MNVTRKEQRIIQRALNNALLFSGYVHRHSLRLMTNLFSLICSPFCRAAAVALPGLLNHLYIRLLLLTVSPRKRSAAEHDIRHGAALLPGGGWRLTRPTVRSSQPLTYPLVRLKLPVLRPQHR